MGITRRIRRNNNMAGLKGQLEDKEKEIYMMSQQQDMQKMYFDEVTKISTALKNILIKELKLDEEGVMKLLEAELDVTEAAEIDEVIKSEAVEAPSIMIVDENEIPDADEAVEEVVAKVDEKVEDKAPKPKKPRKKKESKKED